MTSIATESVDKKNYSIMTIILFWCGLVVLMSMYITIPLITTLTEAFSVTAIQAAWAGSAFSLSYAVGCLLYGPLSDKYGRKVFLVASISVLTALTFIIGFVEDYVILIVLRSIQGLVAAAFAPISLAYAGEMFPPNKRITAIGFITSSLLMASVVGQVFSGLINTYLGWNAVFTILGILYLLTALVVIFYLPKDDLPRSKESLFVRYKKMGDLAKNKQLVLAFSITFMLLLSLVGMFTILGDYLSSSTFGFTDGEILGIRAIGIIGMFLSPFAGKITVRLGAPMVLRVGLALSAISIIVLGFSSNIVVLSLLMVLFISGIAVVTPVMISIISQLAGADRGSAVSFNAFILFLGATVGPILAINLLYTGNYIFAYSVFGAILLVGSLLAFVIKDAFAKASK